MNQSAFVPVGSIPALPIELHVGKYVRAKLLSSGILHSSKTGNSNCATNFFNGITICKDISWKGEVQQSLLSTRLYGYRSLSSGTTVQLNETLALASACSEAKTRALEVPTATNHIRSCDSKLFSTSSEIQILYSNMAQIQGGM